MRMKHFVVATMATAMVGAWSLAGVPVAAQGAAALSGSVTSAAEPKMEGVVVSARREGANVTVSVTSDAKGTYSFPRTHLEAGTYTVTIRAIGYELAAPVSAEVKAGATAKVDLTLQKAKNLASQLSSAEWMMSVNGSQDEKDRFTYQIMSCNYCHTLGRVFNSKHTAESLMPAMQRMVKYYADGTAKSNDNRRGRAAMVQEPGREKSLEQSPNWGAFPEIPRTEIAAFVAKNNLGAGRTTHPFDLKTLPRPTGKGTRVIVTEYDMPTAGTVAHDMDIDSKGTVWYTDESAQILGKFETKTGRFTEIKMPAIPKGQMEGTRDVIVDKNDKVWFPVRVPGNHAVMARFDPLTEKLDLVEGVGGQFVALGGDGFVWAGNNRIDPVTLKVVGKFSYQGSPVLPPGGPHGGYHTLVDSKGNPWVATYRGPGGVIGIDIKSNEVTWINAPGLRARRGKIDHRTDLFWFGEYLTDKIGVADLRAKTVKEWPVRKYSTPYAASIADSKGRVYFPSNGAERMFRLDPKTSEVVEYQMPTEFDSKKLAIDPTTKTPTVWTTNKRTARITKIEPLD